MSQPQAQIETAGIDAMIARARAAMSEVANYDQKRIDRLCQALGWATANEKTFGRIVAMSVEESGLGDPEGRNSKRMKILGILRDALRQKSIGIIEEIPEKGIVKYAKPAGVIASLVPTTNPDVTPPYTGIYAIKCARRGDLLAAPALEEDARSRWCASCARRCSARARRRICSSARAAQHSAHAVPDGDLRSDDRHRRTGDGARRVQLGKPAYGVGAGNATMVIDETADIDKAARNTRIEDHRQRLRLLGRRQPAHRFAHLRRVRRRALKEGGYLVDASASEQLEKVMWDADGHRTARHHRRARRRSSPRRPAFAIPAGQEVHHRRERSDRQGAPLLEREADVGAGRLSSTTASTRRSTWCARSSTSAARATRAASTRSTTSTSTGSR